jgi:hypothetical protein
MKVGETIAGWCAPCKRQQAHTIELIVGRTIKRVCCNVCDARHAHRLHAPGKRPTVTADTPSLRDDPTTRHARAYALALRGRSGAGAPSYATSPPLVVGQLVSHAVFGLGAVTGARENKVDVVFPDGPRVLLQRR